MPYVSLEHAPLLSHSNDWKKAFCASVIREDDTATFSFPCHSPFVAQLVKQVNGDKVVDTEGSPATPAVPTK